MIKPRVKHNLSKSWRWGLVILPILLLLYVFWASTYVSRVMPNTYLGDTNLGGMDHESATIYVSDRIDAFNKYSLEFIVAGENIRIPISELGIEYNREAVVGQIIGNKQASGLLRKLVSLPEALLSKREVSPRYQVDFSVLNARLSRDLAPFEKQAKEASIENLENLRIVESADGRVVDFSLLMPKIASRFNSFDNTPIRVEFSAKKPSITAKMLEKVFDKYKTLTGAKVVFTHEYDNWTLEGASLAETLILEIPGREKGYVAEADIWLPIKLITLKVSGIQDKSVDISLDDTKIYAFLDDIAQAIDRPTVNASLKFEDGKVTEFTPAIDGQKLNLEATKLAVQNKISVQNLSNEPIINLKLPVTVTTAVVANEKINDLGIRELIGKGVSYFGGSIANRVHNVGLGSSRVNGTLVPPGDTFSFNRSVGEVNGATGYRQAYVISAGKTVLDDGGGICQVSTTVFRAALDAGLPIISRTGHAYRVGYYEQNGFGPGLDATVWSPSVDFVFKNDTSKHILVQTIFDPYLARLEVDLYGTRDGRRAEISTPIVSNQVPPPPDKREDDPTLPKGTIKQVDFSAWGANTVFTRKVFKEDKLVAEDVFRTNYRPWQAVFLVGTGG